jgi:hypothetical protein
MKKSVLLISILLAYEVIGLGYAGRFDFFAIIKPRSLPPNQDVLKVHLESRSYTAIPMLTLTPSASFPASVSYNISAFPSETNGGSSITISWSASDEHSGQDWIGLYQVGTADAAFLSWQYTGTASSGNMTFVAPMQASQYEFRYFLNNGYTRAATSNQVTVSASTSCDLSAAPSTVTAGSAITVNWSAPQGHSQQDWVGLYQPGAADASYISWQYTDAASSGSMTFIAPAQAGQYEFRYFFNNGFIRATTSNQVTVSPTPTPTASPTPTPTPTPTPNPPTYSVSAAPNGVTTGSAVTVSWSAAEGHSQQDWVALYQIGAADASYLSWQYTGANLSGSMTFIAPSQAGQYEFRYFLNNGYTRVATSNQVTVSTSIVYDLSAAPSNTVTASAITVNWSAAEGHSQQDWVGLYKAGVADASYLSWQYTDLALSGSMTFTAPAQPGQYEFRYFLNNGYTRVATSNPVAVVSFNMAAAPNNATSGSVMVAVWWASGDHSVQDWVGLYQVGATDTSFLSRQYTGAALSGSMTFTAPAAAGQYEFRYFLNDGYMRGTTSNQITVNSSTPAPAGASRGYLTTPAELSEIKRKSDLGAEPYNSAVSRLLDYVGPPGNWPYGVVDPTDRDVVHHAGALVYAKGMAYCLTGDEQYAASARQKILELSVTDTCGDVYTGSNDCILTLSRHIPGYIAGADLIGDYPGWSQDDKVFFQRWLRDKVYRFTDWASDTRSTNWGSAGSAATEYIADYLAGSGLTLIDRVGAVFTLQEAYQEARERALDRVNSNSYMYNSVCSDTTGLGIRPHGGIPEETGRGSTGCDGTYLFSNDDSYKYMQSHLSGTVLQAELLLRRGDPSLFDNINANGGGSILKAILFVIENPNDPTPPNHWWHWINSRKSILEIAYRYYRYPAIANQLGIGTQSRHVAGDDNSAMPHFGTLTHGFATDEIPALPPVTPTP